MERIIKIEFKNPDHRLFPAIYKITFGDKFYIGKANVPAERMRQHESGINKALRAFFKKRTEELKQDEYDALCLYKKHVKYLYENPGVSTGTVEIIQRGIHPISLYYMENRHLNAVINHPDCLNTSFSSGRPKQDDVRIEKEKMYLFNPITGYGIWPSSISKTYLELKKVMNAGLDKFSYNRYRGSIMKRDFDEDAPFLLANKHPEIRFYQKNPILHSWKTQRTCCIGLKSRPKRT